MLSNLTTPTKNNRDKNTSSTSDYCDNLERMIVETPPIHQSPSTDISTIGGVESNMGDNDTGYDTYTDDVDDEELAYGNIDTTNDISYTDMHLDNTLPLENNTPRATTNDNGLLASGSAAAAAADPPGEHGIGLNGSGIWSPDLQWSPQPKMLHPNLSPSGLSPLRTADNDVELAAAAHEQRSRSSSPTNSGAHNGVKDAAYRHDIMHNNNVQQQHQYATMPEHTLSVPESNDALNDTLNSQSTSGGGLFRPQSRLVKVLCIGSIFLVVAALGLAATGLTMMYTADKNQGNEQVYGNEAVIDGVAELPRVDTNGPSQEQWDILDNSQFDFNIGENGWDGDDEEGEGIDQFEFVIGEEDTGPKAKMTEEPTSPPSVDSIEDEESDETEPQLEIGQGWATEPPVEVPEDEPDTWECRRNGQCAKDGSELCLLDTGDCTGKAGSGVCVGLFQYEDCTDDVTPVCGCDGVDYSNECNAHAAGVSVSHTGLCSSVEKIDPLPTTSPTSPGAKCRFDEQCEVSEFCLFEIDNCLGKRGFGECVPSANFEMCNDLYDPVCGCDGEDYTNSCKANSAGVSVASMGSCSATADVTESTTEPNVLVPGTLLLHSLSPIADTFLEFNETEAFGMRGRLKVDADIERISLLKFDLSSLANVTRTSEIVGMSLKLFSLTDSPYGGKIDLIDDVCNDWTENYITWNNAPECFFQNYTVPSGEFENNILAYEWNEAVLFPDFDFDTVLPDLITLRITSTYANGVTYASRENATAVPQLVVYYTLPVPTVSPTSAAPTVFVSKAPTKSPAPSIELPPTEVPTKIPSWSPTEWPTYYPTSTPTRNATSPSSAPTETPKTIIIPASQDAMVRAGEFSDNRYGKDPFIAMQGQNRKAVIEFDLSQVKPSFEYQYYLQFFVTYVASNNARAVTASYITQQDYTWDEETISWNSMGEPTEEEIGWFSIFKNDENKMVVIPIGNLFNSTVSGNRFILTLTNSAIDTGGDKFDFRSTEFSERFDSLSDSPPTLKAVPQLEEEDEEEEEEVFTVPQVEEEEVL